MKVFVSLLILLSMGCQTETVSRETLNADARQASVASETIEVSLIGASVTSVDDVDEALLDETIPQIQLRAQSLDLRMDVKTNACGATVLHMSLDQLPEREVSIRSQAFLNAINAQEDATQNVTGAAFSSPIDSESDQWTALSSETELDPTAWQDPAEPTRLKWTLCMKRGLGFYRELSGHRSRSECEFPGGEQTQGACAEPRVDGVDPVRSSELVIRYRMQQAVQGTFEFAIWGNDGGERQKRERLMASVNASDALFAIVNGDFTESGSIDELRASRIELDSGLNIPWYATLGDVESNGSSATEYTSVIGASSFAFDVGAIRVIVLDSGSSTIGNTQKEQLESWLDDTTLGWEQDRPASHLIVTHVPPLDPQGWRGQGFRQRSEGASILALASRAQVPMIITSQLRGFETSTFASTRVIHAGGGGRNGATPYWLKVRVDPTCSEVTQAYPCAFPNESGECPCIGLETVFAD